MRHKKGAGVPHTRGKTRNVHVLRVRGAHDTREHGWGHEVQHAQPQAWELCQEAVVHEQVRANACSQEHTTIGAQSAKHRGPGSPKSFQTAHKPESVLTATTRTPPAAPTSAAACVIQAISGECEVGTWMLTEGVAVGLRDRASNTGCTDVCKHQRGPASRRGYVHIARELRSGDCQREQEPEPQPQP
jgi:hypothetical protein